MKDEFSTQYVKYIFMGGLALLTILFAMLLGAPPIPLSSDVFAQMLQIAGIAALLSIGLLLTKIYEKL